MLEIVQATCRVATAVAAPESVPEIEKFSSVFRVHVVRDCCSLHECVLKSTGMSDGKRAAIEISALKGMLQQETFDSDSGVEEESSGIVRLKEKELKDYFLWCVSGDQKADVLAQFVDVLNRVARAGIMGELEICDAYGLAGAEGRAVEEARKS